MELFPETKKILIEWEGYSKYEDNTKILDFIKNIFLIVVILIHYSTTSLFFISLCMKFFY